MSLPRISQISTDFLHLSETDTNERKCIFSVYNELGPGLLEKVYEKIIIYALKNLGLHVKSQVPIFIHYKDMLIESSFIADIIVNDKFIIEIKSISEINNVHHKQLLTYLKLTGLKLGILVNFNTDHIDKNIFRKVNGIF